VKERKYIRNIRFGCGCAVGPRMRACGVRPDVSLFEGNGNGIARLVA